MPDNERNVTFADVLPQLQALSETVSQVVEDVKGEDIVRALKVYWRLKEQYTQLDTLRKKIYHDLDFMDKSLLPAKFDDAEMDLVRIPELERSFYPNTKYSARQKDKVGLMEWLRENGHEDVIVEQVNASTLAGLLKSLLLDEGVEIDAELAELTSYKTIGSSKYAPK